jgi:hypothetical protein
MTDLGTSFDDLMTPGTPEINYSDDEEQFPQFNGIILDTPEFDYDSDSTMVVDWSDVEEDI